MTIGLNVLNSVLCPTAADVMAKEKLLTKQMNLYYRNAHKIILAVILKFLTIPNILHIKMNDLAEIFECVRNEMFQSKW